MNATRFQPSSSPTGWYLVDGSMKRDGAYEHTDACRSIGNPSDLEGSLTHQEAHP